MKLNNLILKVLLFLLLIPASSVLAQQKHYGGSIHVQGHGYSGGVRFYGGSGYGYHSGYYGGYYRGYRGGYYGPWQGTPPRYYPRIAPNRYHVPYGPVVGTYGAYGYIYQGARYIPPPVYVNSPPPYPPTPKYEVIEIPPGELIILEDKVITNKNGRIVVYKAVPDGKQ